MYMYLSDNINRYLPLGQKSHRGYRSSDWDLVSGSLIFLHLATDAWSRIKLSRIFYVIRVLWHLCVLFFFDLFGETFHPNSGLIEFFFIVSQGNFTHTNIGMDCRILKPKKSCILTCLHIVKEKSIISFWRNREH